MGGSPVSGGDSKSDDISGRINAEGDGVLKTWREKGMQIHHAVGTTAPQYRVPVATFSYLLRAVGGVSRTWTEIHHARGGAAPQQRASVALPHLLPTRSAASLRSSNPLGVEVHHAGGAAAPQQRVRNTSRKRTITPTYLLPT